MTQTKPSAPVNLTVVYKYPSAKTYPDGCPRESGDCGISLNKEDTAKLFRINEARRQYILNNSN